MTFAEAWTAARDVEGRLTEAQARRLFGAAAALPAGGRIVEIGSFRGRSAIVLALGARPGVAVVCIDPHVGSDRTCATSRRWRVARVRRAGGPAVRRRRAPLPAGARGPRALGRARAPAGACSCTDAYSSVGVTLALLTSVAPSPAWRYVGRDGSLAAYVRERSDGFGRELGELGFFGRNLVRKGLIAAGLRDGPWPH